MLRPRRGARLLVVASLAAMVTGAPRVRAQDQRPAPAAHKLTRAPRLVHFVEAPYPEGEKAAGNAASVVLELAIDASGGVGRVAIAQSGGPAFDAAAEAAARQFVFEPAEIDGKPAAIRILYRYEFVLRQEAPTTATFTGQVRDRRTKKPLAGVGVSLDSGASATTDDDGHFSLPGVAPGQHVVTLSGPHLTALQTSETLEAGTSARRDLRRRAAGREDPGRGSGRP